MSRVNNKIYARGRFTRDPHVTDKKDGSGKCVFGRIAVDTPFTDGAGDARTATDYFELKVFDDTCAQALIGADAKKGTMIEATGAVKLERQEYEKDGEQRVAYNMVLTLDQPHHEVTVESHPRGEG